MRFWQGFAAAALSVGLSPGNGEPISREATSPPRLVLFLSIDQGRGDYLERFGPLFEGGLRFLLERGVVFEQAHHHHAVTVTAPGHAALATGLHPRRSGIVGNSWFDRVEGREVYCVEDLEAPILPPGDSPARSAAGRSPKRLLGTSIGDWLKESSPDSRVYSVGGKDRSAILMGGKKPDGAFWYDAGSGQWITSRYYMEEYPAWVRALHEGRSSDRYFGSVWEPLARAEGAVDSLQVEARSPSGFRKPLSPASPRPDRAFYEALFASPFIESSLLDFAQALVREEKLGANGATDLLALSFSSVDAVGHAHGPNSPELLDAVLRLDRELGRFFLSLDETVGLSRIAMVLSADHGVAPLPESRFAQGASARRLSPDDWQCFERAIRHGEGALGDGEWFLAQLHFDHALLSSRGVSRKRAEEVFAAELSSCPAVARVWTRSELEESVPAEAELDATRELYRNGFHPTRSPDLFVQLREGHLNRGEGTTHGSPHEYDRWVPGIVLWPGIEPRSRSERVHTVDFSVTLAALLGIPAPEGRDGVDRTPLLR